MDQQRWISLPGKRHQQRYLRECSTMRPVRGRTPADLAVSAHSSESPTKLQYFGEADLFACRGLKVPSLTFFGRYFKQCVVLLQETYRLCCRSAELGFALGKLYCKTIQKCGGDSYRPNPDEGIGEMNSTEVWISTSTSKPKSL